MLVLACGVRPRVDVARASGLPVNKGIVVNDTLATEVPGVYAIGECAEHRGRTYGIVAPVWEQAAVLADVLTGAGPQARYRGSKLYTRLKVAGVDVASMGASSPSSTATRSSRSSRERRNAYRKLIVRDGTLVGAMLVGNTEAAPALVQIFDRGDPLPDDPLEALCSGDRAGGGERERLVCNCHKVSSTRLREAIEAGADSRRGAGRGDQGRHRLRLVQERARAADREARAAGAEDRGRGVGSDIADPSPFPRKRKRPGRPKPTGAQQEQTN